MRRSDFLSFLNEGDAVLFSGGGVVSETQLQLGFRPDRATFRHCGIATREEAAWLLIHADSAKQYLGGRLKLGQVERHDLAERLARVDRAAVLRAPVDATGAVAITAWARQRVGHSYSYVGAVALAVERLRLRNLGTGPLVRRPDPDVTRAFTCTSLCLEALSHGVQQTHGRPLVFEGQFGAQVPMPAEMFDIPGVTCILDAVFDQS